MTAGKPTGASDAFRIPFRYRAHRALLRLIPFVVWGATAGVVVILYLRRETAGLTGFANELRHEVASDTTGRIERLEVALNEEVDKGQIVAILDDREVLLDLGRAKAELSRLEAELDRESALVALRVAEDATELDTELRRFARDIEQTHISYLRAVADLEEDRVRLQGLDLDLERSAGLMTEQVGSVSRLDRDRTARDALAQRIREREPVVADEKARFDAAQRRYDRYLAAHPPARPDEKVLVKPLRYAIRAQAVRLEQINLEVTRLVLRAPSRGRVMRILRRAGEVVTVGETIVQLVEPRATEVVAYLPEGEMLRIRPGMHVRLVRKAEPRRELESVVREVGARVVRLPRRLDPFGRAPTWGVPVHIPLPGNLEATPGEAFRVRLVPGGD